MPITANTRSMPTIVVNDDLTVTAMSNTVVARFVQDLAFVRPQEGDHYLPGRRDSVMWDDGPEGVIGQLEYSIDLGETFEYLDDVPADSGTYYWDVPDTLLSAKAIMHMTHVNTGDTIRVSKQFTIKPYVISRLDENGDLEGAGRLQGQPLPSLLVDLDAAGPGLVGDAHHLERTAAVGLGRVRERSRALADLHLEHLVARQVQARHRVPGPLCQQRQTAHEGTAGAQDMNVHQKTTSEKM